MGRIVSSAGTIENVWVGTPAARLNAFEPYGRVVGQRRSLLATGAPRVYAYRTDYGATFEVRDIPNTALAVCVAVAVALGNGETVSVETNDRFATVYPNCVLAPDADVPQPKLSDPQGLRYSMAFDLLSADGTPFFVTY